MLIFDAGCWILDFGYLIPEAKSQKPEANNSIHDNEYTLLYTQNLKSNRK